MRKIILTAALILMTSACGGGGDSSSNANYAGRWDVSLTRVINDCGLPIQTTFTASPLVNQDGTRVVVDSGTAVLTGTTNNDDGFTVQNVGAPDENGCVTASAYDFKEAGDGNANVGLALIIECDGRQCGVGFGGTGVRRADRSLSKMASENTDLQAIESMITEAVAGGQGEQGSNLMTADALADLVTPAE